jgi:hypothetical protein
MPKTTHFASLLLLLLLAVPGSDPPGIKLRAAKALEAVDYFVPGYWVFSKLIQSLSDIGYDNNNLVGAGNTQHLAAAEAAWSECALVKRSCQQLHMRMGSSTATACHICSSPLSSRVTTGTKGSHQAAFLPYCCSIQ